VESIDIREAPAEIKRSSFTYVQFCGGNLSLGPPQHATRAHRRTFSKPHENGFLNLLGGVYQDGIIEVLRKGGQFGDTFFEGRGDEYLKRGAERANIRLTC
jgi:hypothetical protein